MPLNFPLHLRENLPARRGAACRPLFLVAAELKRVGQALPLLLVYLPVDFIESKRLTCHSPRDSNRFR
jgi:hypothetical protein